MPRRRDGRCWGRETKRSLEEATRCEDVKSGKTRGAEDDGEELIGGYDPLVEEFER